MPAVWWLLALVLTAGSVSAQTPNQELSWSYSQKADQILNIRSALAFYHGADQSACLRLERVLELTEASLQFQADNSDALTVRGLVLRQTGRWQASTGSLETALIKNHYHNRQAGQTEAALLENRLRAHDWAGIRGLWSVQQRAAYSPATLLNYSNAFYLAGDADTAAAIVQQAMRLYPDDLRFLLAELRFPSRFPSLGPRLIKHFRETGGFAVAEVDRWLRCLSPQDAELKLALNLVQAAGYQSINLATRRVLAGLSPVEEVLPLLTQKGLPTEYQLFVALVRQGGLSTLGPVVEPKLRTLSLDSDGDGVEDGRVSWQDGRLTWLLDPDQDALVNFEVDFQAGRPLALRQAWSDGTVTLNYEDYPAVRDLTLVHENQEQRFVFTPYEVNQPIWDPLPAEVPAWLYPWSLSQRVKDLPTGRLQAGVLAQSTQAAHQEPVALEPLFAEASRLEESQEGQLVRRWHFYQGQAFLLEADENRDGYLDTYGFYREGQLTALYRDPDHSGAPSLLEQFAQGQRQSLTADLDGNRLADFSQVGESPRIQLWDWNQDGSPEVAFFRYPQASELKILSFQGTSVPLELFPHWENNPWP